MSESQHLSTYIERPAAEVYAYAMNPANLPNWAAGLSGAIEQRDGRWFADSPMGEIEVIIVPENPHFVLDHEVTAARWDQLRQPDACDRRWHRLRGGIHASPPSGPVGRRLRGGRDGDPDGPGNPQETP